MIARDDDANLFGPFIGLINGIYSVSFDPIAANP